MSNSVALAPGSESRWIATLWRVSGLVKPVLLPFFLTRGVVLITAFFLQWLLDTGQAYKYGYIGDAPLAPLSATFDANWYVDIANHGYSVSGDVGQEQNYAFFPLYPLIVKLVGSLFGAVGPTWTYNLVGVVLSHLFFLVALAFLRLLTLKATEREPLAHRVVWVACAWPWAFVFSMAYTESLFLMLTLGALLVGLDALSRPDDNSVIPRMAAAGAIAALAALTRAQGVLIAIPIIWGASFGPWMPHKRAAGRILRRIGLGVLGAAPPVIAFAVYATLIGFRTGNPMAALMAKGGWGRIWWEDLPRVFVTPPANPVWVVDFISTLALAAWLILTVALLVWAIRLWRRLTSGAAEDGQQVWLWILPAILYSLVYFGVTLLNTPANVSWGRYMTVVFPIFWLVASWPVRHRSARLLAYAGGMLQVVLLAAAVVAQVTP